MAKKTKKPARNRQPKYAYYVDVPSEDGSHWNTVVSLTMKKSAIEYCQRVFGADNQGRVNLITKVRVE